MRICCGSKSAIREAEERLAKQRELEKKSSESEIPVHLNKNNIAESEPFLAKSPYPDIFSSGGGRNGFNQSASGYANGAYSAEKMDADFQDMGTSYKASDFLDKDQDGYLSMSAAAPPGASGSSSSSSAAPPPVKSVSGLVPEATQEEAMRPPESRCLGSMSRFTASLGACCGRICSDDWPFGTSPSQEEQCIDATIVVMEQLHGYWVDAEGKNHTIDVHTKMVDENMGKKAHPFSFQGNQIAVQKRSGRIKHGTFQQGQIIWDTQDSWLKIEDPRSDWI